MIAYLNWVDRFVPPRPRVVAYTDGFWESDAATRNRPEVSRIAREVAVGDDLAPYLSKRAEHKGFAPAKYNGDGHLISSKWRDKDFALNAYGVHHMHLEPATVDECDNSSDTLLFVEFSRDHARLVMVGDHDSFDSPELETAVLKSRLGSGFELKGIRGPRDGGYTPQERNALARAGICTVTSIDGRVLISSSVSTAGIADRVTMYGQRLLRQLAELNKLADDAQWVAKLFESCNLPPPDLAELEWQMLYDSLLLRDLRSGETFGIVEGPRGFARRSS